MVELTSNNYHSLKYSVIPDNKIKQIIGTYTATEPYEVSVEQKKEEVTNLKNIAPSTTYALPCFNNTELDSDTLLYTNVFRNLEIEANEGTVDDTRFAWRNEDIYATAIIDIHNDTPMSFTSNSVSVSNVSGRFRSRTNPHGIYFVLGWLDNFTTEDDGNIYSVRNYNTSGTGWPASDKTDSADVQLSDAQIAYSVADSYYDGSHLDPNTNTYLLRIRVSVRVFRGELEYEVTSGGGEQPRLAGGLNFSMLSSITFNVSYLSQGSAQEVTFEYHVSDSDYEDYPLRIAGNEYTNENVYYGDIIWNNWISEDILSKYRNGKIFINAKIKLSWMMLHNIDINNDVLIKDINNNYISKHVNDKVYPYMFKVKNIEYDCSEEGYYANVILLADVSLKTLVYVVDSNNNDIVDSAENYLMIVEEEE